MTDIIYCYRNSKIFSWTFTYFNF